MVAVQKWTSPGCQQDESDADFQSCEKKKIGLLGLAFRLMELSMNQVGSEHVCAPARFWTRR